MKKYIMLLSILLYVLYLNAENISNRHANPSYKNIKVFTKVLGRSGDSDFYSLQIDIMNTGDSTISFWETPSSYDWIFAFSAVGILVINENERLYFEKKTPNISTINEIRKKVSISPHQMYTIKTLLYIKNRVRFLKTINNLRLIFIFNDANLQFMEDIKQIICEDSIVYKW
jgi:hypothetical protein